MTSTGNGRLAVEELSNTDQRHSFNTLSRRAVPLRCP
uniref:Uncharacterized protein n=1 Tax=Anguilla anguilla TaxID=7936 RepID=A0A0E9UPE6_ANGAN